MKPPRQKVCKVCREKFTPFRPLQVCCTTGCAIQWAREKGIRDNAKIAKIARIEHRQAIKKARPLSWYRKAATIAFNSYIRLRDDKLPCVSCLRHHKGQYHAGHYRSVGANPELRFEPLNCHKQCSPCNTHLSGNLINYRINLIERIGIEAVEWLEGKHEAKKYTKQDFEAIKFDYASKAKTLK